MNRAKQVSRANVMVRCFSFPQSRRIMARRLSLSRSSSNPALKNQTFEVICCCGETLTGPRELHHQEIGCPHCGKTLFVLPADQYATKPRSLPAGPIPQNGETSGTVIDNLNRLALWTRLKE